MAKAKAKSKTWDIVINVALVVAAAGIGIWKYDSCKKKEHAAAEKARLAALSEEGQSHEARVNECLRNVPEADRNECIKCMCTDCLDESVSCSRDKQCRSITVGQLISGEAPPPSNISRIRFEDRASCMMGKCGNHCTNKK
ncbi:MAG: hypothetical protein FWD57_13895 [Polyangiaceae bacterium]|nr:hypothetical protein [Polyangiaceae bacterium]